MKKGSSRRFHCYPTNYMGWGLQYLYWRLGSAWIILILSKGFGMAQHISCRVLSELSKWARFRGSAFICWRNLGNISRKITRREAKNQNKKSHCRRPFLPIKSIILVLKIQHVIGKGACIMKPFWSKFFTCREASRSCRTVGRKKKKNRDLWVLRLWNLCF